MGTPYPCDRAAAKKGDRGEAISIAAFSTGRQPVYIASLHLETLAIVKRTPTWRRPWLGERRLFIPRPENYLSADKAGSAGRCGAARLRVRFEVRRGPGSDGSEVGKRDTIRAVVLLATGKRIRSKPFQTSGPIDVGIYELSDEEVPASRRKGQRAEASRELS
jgi:hypothetical protein